MQRMMTRRDHCITGALGWDQSSLSFGNQESGCSAGSLRLRRPLPGEEGRRDSGQGEQCG